MMGSRMVVSIQTVIIALLMTGFIGRAMAGIGVARQISLGRTLKSHRMTIGDLNGDGRIDYVFNDGRRSILAFRDNGTLLWEKFNPNDPGVEEPYHNFTISVYDIDLDGKAEVICFLEIDGKNHLAVVAGENGEIQCSVEVPFPAPRDHEFWGNTNYYMQDHVAIANLRGRRVSQDILAIHASKLKVAAYAYENNRLVFQWYWVTDHPGYSSGHYAYPYDLNGDGRDEVLAGVDILDPDGKRLWKIPLPPFNPAYPNWGPDHVDAMTAADIDPDYPGIEIIVLASTGMWLYSANGSLLWWRPTKVTDPVNGYFEGEGVQEVLVADFFPEIPGLEMIIYSEDMYSNNSVALFNCKGNVLRWGSQATGPRRWITAAMDWDGDRNVPEIYSRKGIFNGSFQKLSEAMNWGSVKTIDKDEFPPIVADVLGDHREEILFYDEDEIVIFHNTAPLQGELKPSPWEDLRYRMRYANLNHTSPMFFDWRQVGMVPTTDQTPPEPPSSLVCLNATEHTITLGWNRAPVAADGQEASFYRVYRGGSRIAEVTETVYTDRNLKEDTPYPYRVVSVDASGLESVTGAEGTFQTLALYYPHQAPVEENPPLSASIYVVGEEAWNGERVLKIVLVTTEPVIERPSPLMFIESDGSVTHILMRGPVPGNRFDGVFLLGDHVAEGIGIFQLPPGALVNTLGNRTQLIREGKTLHIVRATANDPRFPNPPTDLILLASRGESLTFSWRPPISGVIPSGYRIYRNGVFLSNHRATTYVDTDLLPETSYTYAIYSVDATGNLSLSAIERTFRTVAHVSPPVADQRIYAVISVGMPVKKAGKTRMLPITLQTSEPVVQLPSPLILLESDQTVTRIPLSGKLPGQVFSGALEITDELAGGEGVFSLSPGSLVTQTGQRGQEILQGKTVMIDKNPPPSPHKVMLEKNAN